ncbi:MAG: hypothetical protein LBQ31_03965 [Bacteroidales bacterium]|jgi:hypothetical protein|nr:hypothetical protein [Bacteroidales bacterium]
MQKVQKLFGHFYFLLLAGLAVVFADVRTINDALLYLKINALFFDNGLEEFFASGTPVISSVLFSVAALLPAYIVFLILQYGVKKTYLTVAFLATISCSAVLFGHPYTVFDVTHIAPNIYPQVVFLHVCTTYILEIILWCVWIYFLVKEKHYIKAFLLAVLFPVCISVVFHYAGGYADFIVVVGLLFFNIFAIKKVIFERNSEKYTVVFYTLLVVGLFTFSQQLLPEKKKIEFFKSTYCALENREKLSYYDARQIDIPPIILQRYGNKQINVEFLTYSLFEYHKSTIIFFPQGEILDAFIDFEAKDFSPELFSYKKMESWTLFTDTTLFTDRNVRDSVPFNWYIPVSPFDSIYVSVERNGSNNGFIHLLGYDDRRVPQFVHWVNSTDYFKEHLRHDTVKWEYLYMKCLIPEKTNEVRIYIRNSVLGGDLDTMYFRNLKVEIKKSDIKF